MARTPNNLISRSNVLIAENKNGEVKITVGNIADKVGTGQNIPMWGPPGFVSMPDLPDDDGACQALLLADGAHSIALGFRDNRYAKKSGAIKPGDRLITTSKNARFLLKAEDDGVTMYTANEPDGGSSMAVTMSGKKGETVIVNGKSAIRMTADEITMSAGGVTIQLKGGTFAVYGKHAAFNVGGGNLGVLGIVPPPQGLGSILAGPAGMIGAPSTRWTVALAFLLAFNVARILWMLRDVVQS